MAYDIKNLSKYQQEAQRLHDRYCIRISKRIMSYAVKQVPKLGYIAPLTDKRRTERWCPICGKSFDGVQTECPHCHAVLGKPTSMRMGEIENGCRTFKDYFYFEEITTCRDWQISRMWIADCTFRKTKGFEISYLGVVYERWFNPTLGKEVLLGKYRGSFPYYRRIPWALSYFSSTEVYVHRNLQQDSYEEYTSLRYPNIRLLDYYKDCGMDGLLACAKGNEYVTAFRMMTSKKNRQMAETMMKVGRRSEVNLMVEMPDTFSKYWRTILVARRHGFDFAQYGKEYFDYLGQLERLHLDLRSPHYVAPADFRAMHNEMTARLNAIAERERRERQRQQEIREYEREKEKDGAYKKARGMYFGLMLVSDKYKAEPLKSVADFLEEGLAMDHCVFSCGYYDTKRHPDSLILSVRNKQDERQVTIEISTKTWKICQCYAKHDSIHPQNKQIRAWINENMETIKGFSKPKKRAVAVA